MFDFFNKTPKKEEPPSPSHSAAAAAEWDGEGGSSFLGVLLKKSNIDIRWIAAL